MNKPNGILVMRDGKTLGLYNVISGNQCLSCSYPLEKGYCRASSKHTPDIAKIYSIGLYYKYDRKTYDYLSWRVVQLKSQMAEAEPFGAIIAHLIKSKYPELLQCDCIVPIPQHPTSLKTDKKTKTRYNQAYELARWINNDLPQLPIVEALTKTRAEPLSGAGDSEREMKTIGLYKCDPKKVKGLRVLLVDDVSTSGWSARRCAEELKVGGAKEIRVFVCGINHLD